MCLKDGSLVPVFDNSTKPNTNFVVLGIQCVNKGLVHCRENSEDTQVCDRIQGSLTGQGARNIVEGSILAIPGFDQGGIYF